MKCSLRFVVFFVVFFAIGVGNLYAKNPKELLSQYSELKSEIGHDRLHKSSDHAKNQYFLKRKQLAKIKAELKKLTAGQETIREKKQFRKLDDVFELLNLTIYSTSIGSYRIIGEIRNVDHIYCDFVKINYEFYKNGNLVLTDYGYIDFETYGYSGMLPYSKSFWLDFVDEVEYDELKLIVEYYSEDGSDDIFYDQVLSHTDNEIIKGTFLTEWNGLIKNQTANDVKFGQIFACFLKDNKIIDFDYTFVDYRYPANVQIYSVITYKEGEEEINLYNYSDEDIDLSGWSLGDKDSPDAYQIPNGSVIEAESFFEFAQADLNFTIDKQDQVIYLKNRSGEIVDQFSDEDQYKIKDNEVWGFNSFLSLPDDYDEIVYYTHYALYSLEGNGNINPNIPLLTENSYQVNQSAENSYSAFLIDADFDPIQMMVDWGDGNISDFFGRYQSKNVATVKHTYALPGQYYIRAKATDNIALSKISQESAWSDSILVTVNEWYENLTIAPNFLPPIRVGNSYNATVTASGGKPPYSFEVVSGSLPSGIVLNQLTGVFSGTADVLGEYRFRFRVSDSQDNSDTAEKNYTILVFDSLSILTEELSKARRGLPYCDTLEASGGVPPYQWEIVNYGGLEDLMLDESSGILSFTPSGSGDFDLTLRVEDSQEPCIASEKQLTIHVIDSLRIITNELAQIETGMFCCDTLEASGGVQPYLWEITDQAGLSGVSIDSEKGILNFQVDTCGIFTIQIKVSDSDQPQQSLEKEFSLEVNSYNSSINSDEKLNYFAINHIYPNPFNQSVMIDFNIAQSGRSVAEIYNSMGQKVLVLSDEICNPGQYQLVWNGTDEQNSKLASGIYFCLIRSNQNTICSKLLLLR